MEFKVFWSVIKTLTLDYLQEYRDTIGHILDKQILLYRDTLQNFYMLNFVTA